MSRAAAGVLLAALSLGCGDADDAQAADGGLDAPPACAIPALAGADAFLADVVTHLAAAPRATTAARAAARTDVADRFTALGLDTSLDAYTGGANVVARLPATVGASTWILVGAHFDTVSGSPGADDNATGVAVVLAAARDLAAQSCRAHGVIFAAFDQEEAGLVGSGQLAAHLAAAGTELVAVHTIDQAGWDRDGDRRFEIEQPSEPLWAEYQAAAAAIGVPVTRTTTGDTDHVSFRARGWPAAGVTEEYVGGDTTPHLHTAGDTIATVDLAYTARAAALVTTVVGRELGGDR